MIMAQSGTSMPVVPVVVVPIVGSIVVVGDVVVEVVVVVSSGVEVASVTVVDVVFLPPSSLQPGAAVTEDTARIAGTHSLRPMSRRTPAAYHAVIRADRGHLRAWAPAPAHS